MFARVYDGRRHASARLAGPRANRDVLAHTKREAAMPQPHITKRERSELQRLAALPKPTHAQRERRRKLAATPNLTPEGEWAHLTKHREWVTLVEPVPTDEAERAADTKAKYEARHALREHLRDRAGRRLHEMYDSNTHQPRKQPVASWGSWLEAWGASDELVKPRVPETLRPDAVQITLRRDTVRLGVHDAIEQQFRYAQMTAQLEDTPGRKSTADSVIEGRVAELAVAEALCLFWQPSIGVQTTEVDVGEVVETKYTNSTNYNGVYWGGLRVSDYARRHSHPSRPFVLVVGEAPYLAMVGWLFADEIKTDLTQQTELHPITQEFAKRAHDHSPLVKGLPVGGFIAEVLDALSDDEWGAL